jgi:ADP-ribosyl-[dinitrogen reductase] hydrolase
MKNSMQKQVYARARAAFLGVALGDALGATTEFMNPREIQAKYGVHRKIIGGGWLGIKPGHVTDDTQMSLALAQAITRKQGWDLGAIASEFVEWMRSKPIDIGATVRRGIRLYINCGITEVEYSDWDAGNGAAMRMLPVALYTLGSEELLKSYAVEQAHLTHNHPFSDAACICLGKMTQAAILGANRFELHALTQELTDTYPKFGFNRYNGAASGYIVETMRTVFNFLFTTTSFEECLIGIVNQGGDADTTGAIGGMIAGAFYGPEGLPPRWVKKLDNRVRADVEHSADKLIELSPWNKY